MFWGLFIIIEKLNFGRFWTRFGAVSGPRDTVYREETGIARVTGTPHVARVDSVPRHGHRNPPALILEPSGPVWGRLRAVWGPNWPTNAHGGRKKHARRGAKGPLRWLLGVPAPVQGAIEPHRRDSIFGPVLGLVACCLLPDAQAHPTGLKSS